MSGARPSVARVEQAGLRGLGPEPRPVAEAALRGGALGVEDRVGHRLQAHHLQPGPRQAQGERPHAAVDVHRHLAQGLLGGEKS